MRIDQETPNKLDELKITLEIAIDTIGLESTLSLIGTICSEKAEHIADNWQDKALSLAWEHASFIVESTANHISVTSVS